MLNIPIFILNIQGISTKMNKYNQLINNKINQ